jgi:uncharacterized protein YndB with AHSA1/START domain
MESKTKVHAEDGKQDVVITREFELPVDLLFKAFVEPDLVAQWMGTNVLKLDSKKHGSFRFQTAQEGKVVFEANGTIHECAPPSKIVRTFEMDNTPYGVQLEVYTFEPVGDSASRLHMHVIYESVAQRDEVMKLPFIQGINWAHNRLEKIVGNLK